jgi:hypothetical protein
MAEEVIKKILVGSVPIDDSKSCYNNDIRYVHFRQVRHATRSRVDNTLDARIKATS